MKFHGCVVTEAKDYGMNSDKRLSVDKMKQFDCKLNGATLPVQMMLDKLAKNNAWSVTKSALDDNLTACFEVAINADTVTNHYLTYGQICKEFGWKSFKLSENGQTVLFKKAA